MFLADRSQEEGLQVRLWFDSGLKKTDELGVQWCTILFNLREPIVVSE